VKAKNSPKRILLVSSILLICSVHSIFLFALFGAIALSHLVIILAQSNLLSGIKIKIDLSYGMYLYHFPVMQTIAHYAFCTNHIILSILIGLIISTLIAYISAKCLEQPMIRLAKTLG
jgi:peptidoglycan/LPS O-acetylase OafA/YrhL